MRAVDFALGVALFFSASVLAFGAVRSSPVLAVDLVFSCFFATVAIRLIMHALRRA